jgi:hypothetical protein
MAASEGLVRLRGTLNGQGDSVPNKGVQLTAYSLRYAAASGSS